jgi:hypothetical protein
MTCSHVALLCLTIFAVGKSEDAQTALEPSCSASAADGVRHDVREEAGNDMTQEALGLLQIKSNRSDDMKKVSLSSNVSGSTNSSGSSNGSFFPFPSMSKKTKCCTNGDVCVDAEAMMDFTTLSAVCIAVTFGSYNPITSSLQECTCAQEGYSNSITREQAMSEMTNMGDHISSLPGPIQSAVQSGSESFQETISKAANSMASIAGSDVNYYGKSGMNGAISGAFGGAESGISGAFGGLFR